jgi:hypothetical protein
MVEQGLVLGTLRGVLATPVTGPIVVLKFNLPIVMIFIFAEIIVSVVLYSQYKIVKRLVIYLTSDYLDTTSNYMLHNFASKCITNQKLWM